MENGPFIDGLPIENGWISHGYVSHNQMVVNDYPLLQSINLVSENYLVILW